MAVVPTVTVLVPTFNRADFLAECLDSILSQTLTPAQVIVVNDGSTDDTLDVLAPYRDRIEYVETPQLGKPAAINAGLERVTGKYLWIFDDDDVAFPEALARFVEPLEAHPEHGFSYSTFYYTASRPEDNRLGPILDESRIPDVQERGFLPPLLEMNFLGGAALFARTSCYACVGPFDVKLVRSQDYEMAIRIARRFSGIRIPGGPTFHYRQHAGLRGSARDRFEIDRRQRKWFEYNQVFFRRLYREIPLCEYLPPGVSLKEHPRQAHLQRLAIVASKMLMPEVFSELDALARLEDRTPLSGRERSILLAMSLRRACYRGGSLNDHPEFFARVRCLARSSDVMRLIRRELLSCLPRQWKILGQWKNPHQTVGMIRKALCLYLPGLFEKRCSTSTPLAEP